MLIQPSQSRSAKRIALLLVVALAFLFGGLEWSRRGRPDPRAVHMQPVIGDVATLRTAYARWKEENAKSGHDERVVLPLGWSKGLSSEFTEASGRATFDLAARTLDVEVSP